MNEVQWRAAVYCGLVLSMFEVSTNGDVRSWLGRGPKPKRMPEPRVLKPWRHAGGYLVIKLPQAQTGGRIVKAYVHRLVLETFLGTCPEGLEACHNNGVADDNRLENLRWGTHQANISDKTRHGTQPTGMAHGMSRLSDVDIAQIRAHRGWFRALDLAEWFGVTKSHIQTIWQNRAWRDAALQTRPFPARFYTPVARLGR